MAAKDDLKVPKAMREKYEQIVAITDRVCLEHLNEDYAALSRKMTAELSRKRPSPLATGRVKSWAAGIIYALARINFLFDKSQTPHMRSTELCKVLEVSQATASAKSKTILDTLDLMLMDPRYCLPSLMDDNLLVWLLQVDGMLVDIRTAPRELQVVAYEKGLIPYIPADR